MLLHIWPRPQHSVPHCCAIGHGVPQTLFVQVWPVAQQAVPQTCAAGHEELHWPLVHVPVLQVPHEPPQLSSPHTAPVHWGAQHCCMKHVWLPGHMPHVPPQPSEPHWAPLHCGTQPPPPVPEPPPELDVPPPLLAVPPPLLAVPPPLLAVPPPLLAAPPPLLLPSHCSVWPLHD
jgi:hypothetical protein